MNRERLRQWWKRERPAVWKAVLLACLPVIACLAYCGVQGRSIGQIYLPASVRNDELIYYKQVEAIIRYGYPQGYFGFNESHALKLSFAAWSPVLILPWVLWGLVFGWNLLSPVLCNIFLLTAALFLFGVLAKPGWKQVGMIALLFFLYTPFSWYMLSGMPEIGCISLLIVFYGTAVAYLRKRKGGLLAALFALAGLLTLMRPYLLLFLLLPAYLWIVGDGQAQAAPGDEKRRGIKRLLHGMAVRWRGILGSGAVMAAVLGIYAWINHYLAAEYLEPLFYMDWLTTFFGKGLLSGLRYFFGSLYYAGLEFLRYMRQGLLSGLPAGAIFCCYIAVLLLLFWQSARDYLTLRRRRRAGEAFGEIYGQLVLEGHLTFAFLGMLGAQLLMYNFYDGCKHLLTFLAVSIFVIARMRTAYFKKPVAAGVLFAFFFLYRGECFQDYLPDFEEPAIAAGMEQWNETAGRLVLTGEERPNYDNVVIWVLSDELPQGTEYTGWQYLYSLPAGFGISCCTSDYVTEAFEDLKSRYICVVPGGPVEEKCMQMEYEKIAGNEYAVLYRRD